MRRIYHVRELMPTAGQHGIYTPGQWAERVEHWLNHELPGDDVMFVGTHPRNAAAIWAVTTEEVS